MIDVFMHRIIDYAGMFPPAKLAFEDALANWKDYLVNDRAEYLGKFVLPVDYLAQAELPSRFSLLVRAGETQAKEFSLPKADSFEVDVPAEAWNQDGGYRRFRDFLIDLKTFFPGKGRVFIELDWRKRYAPLMALIAEDRSRFGVKVRTGGVTAESIPPSRALARFLLAAAEHQLPLKATAGLHVPVPNENPEVGARMHGFLNFFSAGFLAFSGRGDEQAVTDVLETFSFDDFSFGERSMRCGTVEFSRQEIEQLRSNSVLSFGSCSFLEPIEHLERHGLI